MPFRLSDELILRIALTCAPDETLVEPRDKEPYCRHNPHYGKAPTTTESTDLHEIKTPTKQPKKSLGKRLSDAGKSFIDILKKAKDPKKALKEAWAAGRKKAKETAVKLEKEFMDAGLGKKQARAAALTIAGSLVSPVGLGTVLTPTLWAIHPALAVLANSPVGGLTQAFLLKEAVKLAARTTKLIKSLVSKRTGKERTSANRIHRLAVEVDDLPDDSSAVVQLFTSVDEDHIPAYQLYVLEALAAGMSVQDAVSASKEDVPSVLEGVE